MKRIVTLCMLAALLAPFLGACSPKEEPKTQQQERDQKAEHKKATSINVDTTDHKGW
jgi:hypothetical protein